LAQRGEKTALRPAREALFPMGCILCVLEGGSESERTAIQLPDFSRHRGNSMQPPAEWTDQAQCVMRDTDFVEAARTELRVAQDGQLAAIVTGEEAPDSHYYYG
jgi:hypothetical protein